MSDDNGREAWRRLSVGIHRVEAQDMLSQLKKV